MIIDVLLMFIDDYMRTAIASAGGRANLLAAIGKNRID